MNMALTLSNKLAMRSDADQSSWPRSASPRTRGWATTLGEKLFIWERERCTIERANGWSFRDPVRVNTFKVSHTIMGMIINAHVSRHDWQAEKEKPRRLQNVRQEGRLWPFNLRLQELVRPVTQRIPRLVRWIWSKLELALLQITRYIIHRHSVLHSTQFTQIFIYSAKFLNLHTFLSSTKKRRRTIKKQHNENTQKL